MYSVRFWSAITYATAVVLALHAVLGCCLHHRHAEVSSLGNAAHHATLHQHQFADHHRHHGLCQPDAATDEQQSPADCQGDRCFAVLSQLSGPSGNLNWQRITPAAAWDDQQLCAPLTTDSTFDGRQPNRALPLRAHLLLSVLIL